MVELAGSDVVELFAGEADVAEVRRSVDLERLVNVLKHNALQPSPESLAITKNRPRAGQGCERRAMLTCSTINVFKSTDKSMNLSRAAMMLRRQTSLNLCVGGWPKIPRRLRV